MSVRGPETRRRRGGFQTRPRHSLDSMKVRSWWALSFDQVPRSTGLSSLWKTGSPGELLKIQRVICTPCADVCFARGAGGPAHQVPGVCASVCWLLGITSLPRLPLTACLWNPDASFRNWRKCWERPRRAARPPVQREPPLRAGRGGRGWQGLSGLQKSPLVARAAK